MFKIFSLVFVLGQIQFLFTQNTTFIRPSLCVTTVSNQDRDIQKLNQLLNQVRPYRFNRFNLIPLTSNSHSKSLANIGKFTEYKKSQENLLKSELGANYDNFNGDFNKISKEVIDFIFSYNNGKMSYDNLYSLAIKTSTDIQQLSSDNSKNKFRIYDQLTEDLMKKLYAITIVVRRLETYDEMYRRENTPAKDQHVYGYRCVVDYYITKLSWDTVTSNNFFQNCWVDETTPLTEIPSKKSAYNQFKLQSNMVFSGRTTAYSNFPLDLKNQSNAQTMESLFYLLSHIIVESIFDDVSIDAPKQISRDFRIYSSLTSTYPNLIKLGTKDAIRSNQRYFAYEQIEKSNGKINLKRKGVLRVKEIVVNNSDFSKTSTLRQEGGRKLYPGMLIYEEFSKGKYLTLGYNLSSPNTDLNQYSLGFSERLVKDVFLGLNFGLSAYKDVKYLKSDTILSNGVSIPLGLEFARELYFTRKGNVFLYPSCSVNFTMLGLFVKSSEVDANNNGIRDSKELSDSRGIPVFVNSTISFGLGARLSPTLSILFRPQLNYNLFAVGMEADPKDNKVVDISQLDEFWNFNYGLKTNFFSNISLRLQF